MKTHLLGLFIILIISSCAASKKADNTTTIDDSKTNTSERVTTNPYKLIQGNWKMDSYQVYSPNPDATDTGETFWEFKDKGEILITNYAGKTATANPGKYWMNKSIVNINGTLYMYYFEELSGISRGDNAKPYGDELWLDSNLDPSISAHGPKIHFTRVK